MIDKIEIEKILKDFSKDEKYFQNEQQFQFELGYEIQKNYCKKDEKVIFEYPAYEKIKAKKNKRAYIDLIVVNNVGEYVAIELKYKTKKGNYDRPNYGDVELTDQIAQDLGRYDYLKDIWRIEKIKQKDSKTFKYKTDLLKKYITGFAIMISNDKLYWEKTEINCNKKVSYKQYCIGDGDSKTSGKLYKWGVNGKGKSFTDRKPLSFIKNYTFKWEIYGASQNKKTCPQFKYIISEI